MSAVYWIETSPSIASVPLCRLQAGRYLTPRVNSTLQVPAFRVGLRPRFINPFRRSHIFAVF